MTETTAVILQTPVIYGPTVVYAPGTFGHPCTVAGAMQAQNPCGWEFFACETCLHWKGGCGCKRNVFISVVGANMSGCRFYEAERRKRETR